MEKVTISLSDNNYTTHARAMLSTDPEWGRTMGDLLQKMEHELYTQHDAYLCIEGVRKEPIWLRVTGVQDTP